MMKRILLLCGLALGCLLCQAAAPIRLQAWANGMIWLCDVFQCDPRQFRDLQKAFPSEYDHLVSIAVEVAGIVKARHLIATKFDLLSESKRQRLGKLVTDAAVELSELRRTTFSIPEHVATALKVHQMVDESAFIAKTPEAPATRYPKNTIQKPKPITTHEAQYLQLPSTIEAVVMKDDSPSFDKYQAKKKSEMARQLESDLFKVKEKFELQLKELTEKLKAEETQDTKAVKEQYEKTIAQMNDELLEEKRIYTEGMTKYGQISSCVSTLAAEVKSLSQLLSDKQGVKRLMEPAIEDVHRINDSLGSNPETDQELMRKFVRERTKWTSMLKHNTEIASDFKVVCSEKATLLESHTEKFNKLLTDSPKTGMWFTSRYTWYQNEEQTRNAEMTKLVEECFALAEQISTKNSEFSTFIDSLSMNSLQGIFVLISNAVFTSDKTLDEAVAIVSQLRELSAVESIYDVIETELNICLEDTSTCHKAASIVSTVSGARLNALTNLNDDISVLEKRVRTGAESISKLLELVNVFVESKLMEPDEKLISAAIKMNGMSSDLHSVISKARQATNRLRGLDSISTKFMAEVTRYINACESIQGSDTLEDKEADKKRYDEELRKATQELDSLMDKQKLSRRKVGDYEREAAQIRAMGIYAGPSAEMDLQVLEQKIKDEKNEIIEQRDRVAALTNDITTLHDDIRSLEVKMKRFVESKKQSENIKRSIKKLMDDLREQLTSP